ncbi:uncharacterized protein N7511_004567 [Penicillium nucicola]|uniref:uncharacterized protein n=1 Tax=Penicillium nucicola TaxID=1850975 RepID=UPI002545243F|nr:uncharacterized protein N7511_004567 [Penicillium nucicola]KAJ5766951.1 hypothetical protein N7511_004567 [Penicillium nucicola]
MSKVFITGVTGYIGGDVLSQLIVQYPTFTYRVLVRTEEKGKQIQARYPQVQIVYGDLNDSTILKEESAHADIIIPNKPNPDSADAADNLPAAKSIVAGIVQGHTPERPAYWLHTSGAGIFSYIDEDEKTYGMKRAKIFDDWDGIKEIVSIPDHAFHRDVDKVVLEAAGAHADVLRAAIISPVTVYGVGRGPCSQRSRQVYELARTTIKWGKAPIIGLGESMGTNVHIHDLTDLFVLFVQGALDGNELLWGPESYVLAENGEHCWGDLARSIARIAVEAGFISSAEEQTMDIQQARDQAGFEAASWGLNVRCRALRARKLGWKPTRPSLEAELREIIQGEWDLLQ